MNRPQARHGHGWRWSIALTVVIAAASTPSKGQSPTGAAARPPAQEAPLIVMSPKAKSAGWTGVHRPHTKLRDVLARHHGQADWAETIVDDESLFAQWISMGPGRKTPRRMNGDTREWWIVQSGTLRFHVDGREPVVATKGVMVQVPYRTLYQIENVGTDPALRFEVNVTARASCIRSTKRRTPVSGFEYVKTRVTGGRGVLDPQNRPVVDFNKVVAGQERAGAFVTDDRSFANIIMGPYQKPQPGNKGHYHEEGGEFWLIMLGKIRYNIEGLQEFEAEEG
jgi:mannose-6-phosphate isomerase-like protein (cupin superfamily)